MESKASPRSAVANGSQRRTRSLAIVCFWGLVATFCGVGWALVVRDIAGGTVVACIGALISSSCIVEMTRSERRDRRELPEASARRLAGGYRSAARPHVSSRIEMIEIPEATFSMGSDERDTESFWDERPVHEVTLSRFWISKFPVTQALFRSVMGLAPIDDERAEWPVFDVTWIDAVLFCNRLSALEGLERAYDVAGESVAWSRGADGYRLPTEAEWEFAARGTDRRLYPWGNARPANQLCWRGPGSSEGGVRTAPSPVGSHPSGASPFGVMDMLGSVHEWCWDWVADYDGSTLAFDPVGPRHGRERVLRGGGWADVSAARIRAAYRARLAPLGKDVDVGFRCARG